jgi:hypothetical protein
MIRKKCESCGTVSIRSEHCASELRVALCFRLNQVRGTQFAEFISRCYGNNTPPPLSVRVSGSASSVLRPHIDKDTTRRGNIMNTRLKKRDRLCPSTTEAKLEERIVLSSTTTDIPAPAPAPFFSSVVIGNPLHTRTVGQMRRAHAREVTLATVTARSSAALKITPSVHPTVTPRASVVAASGMRFVPTTPSALSVANLSSVASARSSDLRSSGTPVPAVTPSPSLTTISLGSTGFADGVEWQSR